jgi:short-subunit dehydrogenase
MNPIRRLFVTGASTGLGQGLADHYARAGAHLGLVARRESLLRDLEKEWTARGARVEVYAGDVADSEFMAHSAQAFVAAAGGVDLVFANAGVGIASHHVLEGDAREIAWLMNVNVIGVTNTVVPFVPHMVKQGSGVLCAVGSMAGHQPLPGRAAYSASKACVRYFMSALRMDLHGTGVHAMTLCPGFVETALTEGQAGMMFVIDVPEAVRYMVGAIESRKNTYTFPWQMNLLKEVMARVPEPVIRRLAPPARAKSSS